MKWVVWGWRWELGARGVVGAPRCGPGLVGCPGFPASFEFVDGERDVVWGCAVEACLEGGAGVFELVMGERDCVGFRGERALAFAAFELDWGHLAAFVDPFLLDGAFVAGVLVFGVLVGSTSEVFGAFFAEPGGHLECFEQFERETKLVGV